MSMPRRRTPLRRHHDWIRPLRPQPVTDQEENMSELNGAIFVINPGGITHSISPNHPAFDLARNGREGWRLASDEERDAALRSWGQADLIPSTTKGERP
jgi:hypothetical protein